MVIFCLRDGSVALLFRAMRDLFLVMPVGRLHLAHTVVTFCHARLSVAYIFPHNSELLRLFPPIGPGPPQGENTSRRPYHNNKLIIKSLPLRFAEAGFAIT